MMDFFRTIFVLVAAFMLKFGFTMILVGLLGAVIGWASGWGAWNLFWGGAILGFIYEMLPGTN